MQRRQAFGGSQLNLNLTPSAIARHIRWTVSEHILVAQFNAYFGGDIGQFIRVIDGKSAAPGHFRDLSKKGGACSLLRSAEIAVKDANGIKLDVSFLHHGLDFILRI